jgi:hypothetical protein
MWVISKYGFASAVQHTDKPGCVLVRARDKGDLQEFCEVARDCDVPGFSEEAIEENPSADYRFRMTVRDEDWAQLVKVLALGVDYPNFKNEVASVDPGRAGIYGGVWSELMKIQYPESGGWPDRAEADRRDRLSSLYRRAADHLRWCHEEYTESQPIPEEEAGSVIDPPILPEQVGGDPTAILEERMVQRIAIGFFDQASGEGFERLKDAERRARLAAELRLDDDDWVPEG